MITGKRPNRGTDRFRDCLLTADAVFCYHVTARFVMGVGVCCQALPGPFSFRGPVYQISPIQQSPGCTVAENVPGQNRYHGHGSTL